MDPLHISLRKMVDLKPSTNQQKILIRISERGHTAAVVISPLDTNTLTINSRAARSPIFDSMARFRRFLAVSIALFLI